MNIPMEDFVMPLGRHPFVMFLIALVLLLGGTTLAASTASTASSPAIDLGPAITVCVRQDEAGYRGSEDTDINKYDREANYGNSPALRVKSDNAYNSLIQFSMPAIPSQATISQATLRLYTTYSSNPAYPITIQLHRVLRLWNEMDASWTYATAGIPWGLPGCNDTSSDRAAIPSDEQTATLVGQWLEFDITDDVRLWFADPSQNHGHIARGAGEHTVQYNFASSEYTNTAFRPELCITYYEATPTPTITNTPTKTATPTATPTFTPTLTPTPTPTRFTGDIHGLVWHDMNGNRLRDPDEPPLPNAQVILRTMEGALMMLQTTGGDGVYMMGEIVPGSYWLQEVDPPGFISTTPNDWGVTVFSNTSVRINFGDRYAPTPTATLTPTVTRTPTPTITPTETLVPCRDIFEPDDSPADAKVLSTNGLPQGHNIHRAGDMDYIKFSAFEGVTYRMRTLNLGGGVRNDTTLRLLAPDGATVLAENDDDPANPPASSIQWICPTSGSYYLLVRQYNPSVGGCDITYDILIQEMEPTAVPTATPSSTRAPAAVALPFIVKGTR